MSETTDTKTPEQWFALLNNVFTNTRTLADLGVTAVQLQQRVTAHVRARTGHSNLMAYHHNGATDQDKIALYKEILKAVFDKDLGKLAGSVASGQATVEVESISTIPAEEKPETPQEAPDTVKPEPEPSPRETKPARPVSAPMQAVPAPANDAVEKLRQSLALIMGPMTGKAEIDAAKVKEIVESLMEAHKKDTEQSVEKRIKMALESIPPRAVLEIREVGKPLREVKGLTHFQVPQVVAWLNAGVPVWLWGAAGAGKSTMHRQIAEALELEPYMISIDSTMTVGKLMGFRNLANGEFVKGLIYPPYASGGLAGMDEVSTGDPGVLAAANTLIAQEYYMFPDGKTVQKHERFRLVVYDNTKGTGATAGYTARNRLDAATLDRFAVIELVYDEALEYSLATGMPKASDKTWSLVTNPKDAPVKWVEWVQRVRRTVGQSVLISPRASINGAKALRAGISPAEVAEALVFKLVTPDTRSNIVRHCGEFAL